MQVVSIPVLGNRFGQLLKFGSHILALKDNVCASGLLMLRLFESHKEVGDEGADHYRMCRLLSNPCILQTWYDGGQMGFDTRGKAGWSFQGLRFGGGLRLSYRKWLPYPFERCSGQKISCW